MRNVFIYIWNVFKIISPMIVVYGAAFVLAA